MAVKVQKSESWKAAEQEGLCFFWAFMHVGRTIQFVGQSWEDGGFTTDDEGDPVSDVRGNTVASSSVEKLDSANNQHVEQVAEWWG